MTAATESAAAAGAVAGKSCIPASPAAGALRAAVGRPAARAGRERTTGRWLSRGCSLSDAYRTRRLCCGWLGLLHRWHAIAQRSQRRKLGLGRRLDLAEVGRG